MTLSALPLSRPHFVRHFSYGDLGVNLNSRVSMCGFESPPKESYIWHGLKRGDSELLLWQYTLSGAGELVCGGETHRIPPGRAMLLQIPGDHCYRVAADASHWEFVFLILRGTECLRLGGQLLERQPPVSERFVTPALLETAEAILFLPEADRATELSELAYRFMMKLVDSCGRLTAEPASPALRRARKHILKNFDRPLQVEELAALANMSYAYFCREFTRDFGIAPGKYIARLRFEKAIDLLQNSFLSIKEIATCCGFSGPVYFCRAFTTRFGLPPGDYRKRKRE